MVTVSSARLGEVRITCECARAVVHTSRFIIARDAFAPAAHRRPRVSCNVRSPIYHQIIIDFLHFYLSISTLILAIACLTFFNYL